MSALGKYFNAFTKLEEVAGFVEVSEYPGFIYVLSSVRNDPWQSYLAISDPKSLDTDMLLELFNLEKKQGVNLGIYIDSKLSSDFAKPFKSKGLKKISEDNYIARVLTKKTKKFKIDIPDGYEISDDYNIDEVIDVLTKAYNGWDGEKIYAQTFEVAKKRMYDNYFFKTLIAKFNGKVVGAVSIAADLDTGFAYFHNGGVLKEHRRKGVFSALNKERINVCIDNGLKNVFGIVENNGPSHKAWTKLGLKSVEKYTIYN